MSDTQQQCNHAVLQKLGGALHPSGKDYVCKGCGEQFKAELRNFEGEGQFGKPESELKL
jgi:hypothetical protein